MTGYPARMPQHRTVHSVDLGFTSAKQFWAEVVVTAYQRFEAAPTRVSAFETAVSSWHLLEWAWHDRNPGVETRDNKDFTKFHDDVIKCCPELEWLRDVADAGKHRYLHRTPSARSVKVKAMREGEALMDDEGFFLADDCGGLLLADGGLHIELEDGTLHDVSAVLATVTQFWRKHFDP